MDSKDRFAKYEKKEKLGDSPIQHDSLVFFDQEKRKEWELLNEGEKSALLYFLKKSLGKMEASLSIQILANSIIDLQERIQKLEIKQ